MHYVKKCKELICFSLFLFYINMQCQEKKLDSLDNLQAIFTFFMQQPWLNKHYSKYCITHQGQQTLQQILYYSSIILMFYSFCLFAYHLIDLKLENPTFIFRSDYVIVRNHNNQKTAELK
jgi:hypothetical protein